MSDILDHMARAEALIIAFATIGALMLLSSLLSRRITGGRIHASAFAIMIGLALAYGGGLVSHGHRGLADVVPFSGLVLLGGAMMRDFAVASTAFEVDVARAWRAGVVAFLAVGFGTAIPLRGGARPARGASAIGTRSA